MRLRDAPRDASGRPIVDGCYGALIAATAAALPEHFAALDPLRILVLAGAARRESSASVRPLAFGGVPPRREEGGFTKPRVTVSGRDMLYEIALRPRFFLEGDARGRLETLVHELWHIAPSFDGTLAEDRRHDARAAGAIEREARDLTGRLEGTPARDLATELLGYTGELRLRAWRVRPPSREPRGSSGRALYGDGDLYLALIEQQ